MKLKKAMCALLSMGLIAAPAFAVTSYADETETADTAMTETEEAYLIHGNVESEIKDGVFTVRIESLPTDDPNFHWQSDRSEGADESVVQCLTETDMEDGLAYAGSFRGMEDGEGTIRLVHTNDVYTDGYLEFNVTVKDGKITENTGGSEGFGATGEDLAPAFVGIWQEEDGTWFMNVSISEDNALEFVISNEGGKDGSTVYYTMTAYYDSLLEELVYVNGTEHAASITDDSETESEAAETVTGDGKGKFIFTSGDGETVEITWQDDSFGNTEVGKFVRK